MPVSMTGYGRHAIETDRGELVWELRAVNHRYLEISTRLPEEFRALEPAVRELLNKRLSRGKVDVGLRLRSGTGAQAKVHVDEASLDALVAAIEHVRARLPESAPVDPMRVLQWPGVVGTATGEQDKQTSAAMTGLAVALDDFMATRTREGEKTADLLRSRSAEIKTLIEVVRGSRPAVVARQKEKLLAKLAEIDIEHEPQRVEQELVFVAQRLDIDEELDRLDTHITELDKALKRTGPVGRRLDFLMQEFNREANTLGSKSSDADTTKASVDIKVLIEQMREQVQNLE